MYRLVLWNKFIRKINEIKDFIALDNIKLVLK